MDRLDVARAHHRRAPLFRRGREPGAPARAAAEPASAHPARDRRRRYRGERGSRAPAAQHRPHLPPAARDRQRADDLPERRRGLSGDARRDPRGAREHRPVELHHAGGPHRHALHRCVEKCSFARRRGQGDRRRRGRRLAVLAGLQGAARGRHPGRAVHAFAAALADAARQSAVAQEDSRRRRTDRLHRRHEHRRRERDGDPSRQAGAGFPFQGRRAGRLAARRRLRRRLGLCLGREPGGRRLVPAARSAGRGEGARHHLRPRSGPGKDRIFRPAGDQLRARQHRRDDSLFPAGRAAYHRARAGRHARRDRACRDAGGEQPFRGGLGGARQYRLAAEGRRAHLARAAAVPAFIRR